jgi:hypothetical protein
MKFKRLYILFLIKLHIVAYFIFNEKLTYLNRIHKMLIKYQISYTFILYLNQQN